MCLVGYQMGLMPNIGVAKSKFFCLLATVNCQH